MDVDELIYMLEGRSSPGSSMEGELPVWFDPSRKYKARLADVCACLDIQASDVPREIPGSISIGLPGEDGAVPPELVWLSFPGIEELCKRTGREDVVSSIVRDLGVPEIDPYHVEGKEVDDIRATSRAFDGSEDRALWYRANRIYNRIATIDPGDIRTAVEVHPSLRMALKRLADASEPEQTRTRPDERHF